MSMADFPQRTDPSEAPDPGHEPPARVARVPVKTHGGRSVPAGGRAVPEETPVALSYNGTTQAVMMASPGDLEDFAVGFTLTEGLAERPDEIRSIDIAVFDEGIDLRIWLDTRAATRFSERRRGLVGPTGCGLCGIESLGEAVRVPAHVRDETRIHAGVIREAQALMVAGQALRAETSAVHAAAFWKDGEGLIGLREDVGRHNALDKLVGALSARMDRVADWSQRRPGAGGLLLLTSRVSVEMVMKAAVLGAPVLAAVSAPTALAVRTADAAGITLVASAREDGFEVFTHPDRIDGL